MEVILQAAVSLDGYIAKEDGDSDLVSPLDGDLFLKKCVEVGCVIVGRKTFKQYYRTLYSIAQTTTIVISCTLKVEEKGVFFVRSVDEALELARAKGFSKVLIAEGGTTNTSFLREGLIDYLFLTVHPLILGKGIKVFENLEVGHHMRFIGSKSLGQGLIQIQYRK